jgi:D-sedoheptulose 7-phosphate isomerase
MSEVSFELLALDHVREAIATLGGCIRHVATIDAWGAHAAGTLARGGRLLAVGNGGSAAHAQHLTSELVGRYRDERRPLSALALHAESSSFTAIANDYGVEQTFARQVHAHGRPGDVLVALSTSGASPNVVTAVRAAHDVGLATWALTGPVPNPLAAAADACIDVPASATATVQEAHQVLVHLLCEAVDLHLAVRSAAAVP